jgi:predicted 3-demethylubiquinone-9 3-methyltransferase (glyoxalase superfamily)
MQKITPFLWFDMNAEEAMNYYVSVFAGSPAKKSESKVISVQRYPDGPLEGPMKGMEGKVLTEVFELAGVRIMALDGGSHFKFTEAISLLVDVESQEELDYYWGKLSAVPQSEQCGWCKDKFGLSWQIAPMALMGQMMGDKDKGKGAKVMQAMLQMKKIDIATLKKAYEAN